MAANYHPDLSSLIGRSLSAAVWAPPSPFRSYMCSLACLGSHFKSPHAPTRTPPYSATCPYLPLSVASLSLVPPSLFKLNPPLDPIALFITALAILSVLRSSTMIKTLSPYSKTAEIMSRYRPIAPKPASSGGDGEPVMSNKISQSPYLRNIWPQLQARPTRTRKRGRTSTLSPPSALMKRQRPVHHPSHLAFSASPARSLSLHGFVHAQAQAHGLSRLHVPSLALGCSLETTRVTLPLLPCKPMGSVASLTEVEYLKPNERAIDLNTVATHEVPVEKDFLQQLQRPPSPPPLTASGVIAPQPIRPVGSVIRVERINSITGEDFTVTKATKTRQEVEEEAESEALPVVISDSHNKVRMANCAYKEMVGQPECPWLDRMVSSGKRISGEVMLQFLDSDFKVPVSSTGFSCWVKIEWGNEGKKSCAHAFCDVIRLSSETKDYEFAWRFRIQTREAASPSCSNA